LSYFPDKCPSVYYLSTHLIGRLYNTAVPMKKKSI